MSLIQLLVHLLIVKRVKLRYFIFEPIFWKLSYCNNCRASLTYQILSIIPLYFDIL